MRTVSACDLFLRCIERRTGEDWCEFVHRYSWRIQRLIQRAFRRYGVQVGDSELEEFVQDLYCRLLAARSRRFQGQSEPELWCYLNRIARSLAVDHQRARRAQKRRPELSGSRRDVPAWLDEAATDEASPEERFFNRERWRLFFVRCYQVARRDRMATWRVLKVVRLAVLEGWSSLEIADRLGGTLTPAQIDGLIHRIKGRLATEGIRLPARSGGLPAPPLELSGWPQGALC